MIKRENKRERKESENYKTENGRKLVMKERGKREENRKRDKEKNLACKNIQICYEY